MQTNGTASFVNHADAVCPLIPEESNLLAPELLLGTKFLSFLMRIVGSLKILTLSVLQFT